MLIDVNLDQPTSDQRVTAGAQGKEIIHVRLATGSPIEDVVEFQEPQWSQPGIAQR